MNFKDRTERLLGKENIQKLKSSHILIAGIGGVGGFSLESLARIGVEKFTIIDPDIIDITNINRQTIAFNNTINKKKIDVFKERLLDINSDIKILCIDKYLDENNIEEIFKLSKEKLGKIDYVIDAIDSIDSKFNLIKYTLKNNIKCISGMSAGFRLNSKDIQIDTLEKTKYCPLSKKLRKMFRDEIRKIKNNDKLNEDEKRQYLYLKNYAKHKVIYSTECIKNTKQNCIDTSGENIIPSISYIPAIFGLKISEIVIKDLLNIK